MNLMSLRVSGFLVSTLSDVVKEIAKSSLRRTQELMEEAGVSKT